MNPSQLDEPLSLASLKLANGTKTLPALVVDDENAAGSNNDTKHMPYQLPQLAHLGQGLHVQDKHEGLSLNVEQGSLDKKPAISSPFATPTPGKKLNLVGVIDRVRQQGLLQSGVSSSNHPQLTPTTPEMDDHHLRPAFPQSSSSSSRGKFTNGVMSVKLHEMLLRHIINNGREGCRGRNDAGGWSNGHFTWRFRFGLTSGLVFPCGHMTQTTSTQQDLNRVDPRLSIT